ncbi:cellobiohydrolase, partial [Nonomuraea sp. MG754425]|uniref:cellulose binding domain-containing protein n=1 Tax=Nonomuraea sp. MG754425 TaxID=2570319 RepID=UPI001F37BA24
MTAASVAALGLIVGQSPAANAAVACDVTYTANSWTSSPGQGGFTASITLKNTGDPLTSWSLAFDYPTTGQKYTPTGWGANWTQSGTRVTGT